MECAQLRIVHIYSHYMRATAGPVYDDDLCRRGIFQTIFIGYQSTSHKVFRQVAWVVGRWSGFEFRDAHGSGYLQQKHTRPGPAPVAFEAGMPKRPPGQVRSNKKRPAGRQDPVRGRGCPTQTQTVPGVCSYRRFARRF